MANTYKFNREHIKKSDMIGGYGAGKELVKNQLKEDLKEMYFEGVEDFFYEAQDNITPMVSVLKETFQTLWEDERTEYTWTLPDGFVAYLRPVETVEITVNPFNQLPIKLIAKAIVPSARNTRLGVSIIHSVDGYVARELISRCKYDVEKCLTVLVRIDEFLALNQKHHDDSRHSIAGIISHTAIENLANLDDSEYELYSKSELIEMRQRLIKILEGKSFPVKPIHDGFGCHPNNEKAMNSHYSDILAELTDGHLLESIIMEISGKTMLPLTGDLTGDMVRENSKYAIS